MSSLTHYWSIPQALSIFVLVDLLMDREVDPHISSLTLYTGNRFDLVGDHYLFSSLSQPTLQQTTTTHCVSHLFVGGFTKDTSLQLACPWLRYTTLQTMQKDWRSIHTPDTCWWDQMTCHNWLTWVIDGGKLVLVSLCLLTMNDSCGGHL